MYHNISKFPLNVLHLFNKIYKYACGVISWGTFKEKIPLNVSTCFHNMEIISLKNIPLNVLFPLNILTTVYVTWIWNKFTQVWGKVDFRKDITYVTTTPLPVKPRFQAGLTFMSNPPRAPRFKCHCCANIGSLIKEPCRLIRVIW